MPRPPPTPCPNCAPGPRAFGSGGPPRKLVQVESGGGFVRSAHHASHPHPGAHSAYAHEVPLRAAAGRSLARAWRALLLVDHGEEVGAPPPPTPPAPPGPVGRGMPPPG